jgi:hypothetical protein
MAIQQIAVINQSARGPRIRRLGIGIGLQIGIPERRMALNLRPDSLHLDWKLAVPRETSEPLD